MAPDLLGCRVGSPVTHGQKDAHRISAHESQKTALVAGQCILEKALTKLLWEGTFPATVLGAVCVRQNYRISIT